MERLEDKLRNASGASMILAMGIMLAVSVLCASMLSLAATAPQAAYAQQQQQQAYLAVTSAASLLKKQVPYTSGVFFNTLTDVNGGSGPATMTLLLKNKVTGNVSTLDGYPDFQVTLSLSKTAADKVTVEVSNEGYAFSLVFLYNGADSWGVSPS